MELNLDEFFPCTVDHAKLVFGLINEHSSDETIAELKEYFLQKISSLDVKKEKTMIPKYERMLKLLQKQTERR